MKQAVRWIIMAAMLLMISVPVEAATKTRLSATSIAMDAGAKTKIKLVKYKKLSKKQLKKVKWTSSNKKVATVKASGKYKQNAMITAKHSGKTTIKVIYNGKSYRCKVTVNQEGKKHQAGDVDDDDEEDNDSPEKKKDEVIAATSITIDQGSKVTLTEGDTYQLTATVIPSNAPVHWSSSNPSVATVDQNGLVTVLKGGKAGISCVSLNTKKLRAAIMAVTVNLKAKYTYECYLIGDVYNAGFMKVGLYDDGCTPIYIKTDNPNPETIEMQYVSGYSSNNYHNFADVKYTTEADKEHGLRKVEGGYLGLLCGDGGTYEKRSDGYYYLNINKKLNGTVTSLIREFETSDHNEWSQPYAEAGSFTFEVKDFYKEMDAWMDQVIAEHTTSDMNVHEKMLALSKYVMDEFEYLPRGGDRDGYGYGQMALAQRIEPFFITHLVESTKGPKLLENFAAKIGYKVANADDLVFNNKYDNYHGYILGTYNGVTYAYCGIPQSETSYYLDEIKEYTETDDNWGLNLCYIINENGKEIESVKPDYNKFYPTIYYYRNIHYVDFSKFK